MSNGFISCQVRKERKFLKADLKEIFISLDNNVTKNTQTHRISQQQHNGISPELEEAEYENREQ